MQRNQWLSRIVTPGWQVFFLAITTVIITIISQKAVDIQTPLEKCPGLKHITQENIKEWGADPAKVSVGLQITHIPKFNTIDDKFVFEGKLWFVFDPELISLDTIKKFSIEKGLITYQSEPELKLINNLLFAEINIRIKCNSGLIHTAFPLDSHRIFINLINTSSSPQELLFYSDTTQFIISPEVYVPEWKAVQHAVATGYTQAVLDTDDATKTIRHPKVLFSIDFNRTGLRHVFIILLPLFLICAMAMMALGAQERIGGDKALDIALAAAASIIAYRFVIESMSPHASCFMVVDYIFTFFLLISCAQLIFSKITYKKEYTPALLWTRAILLSILYGFFIILWYLLLFVWIPSKYGQSNCLSTPPLKTILETEPMLCTKKKTDINAQHSIFNIGTTVDLSRSDKHFGHQIKRGIELRLHQEEQNSSSHLMPAIEILDDESFPLKATNNIKKLLGKNIPIILCPTGSSTLQSYLPLIEEKKVTVLFPISGSVLFRRPDLSHIIHYRPSSAQEAALITEYAYETLHAGRIVIAYEETPFGLSALAGARHAITELAIPKEHVTEIGYPKQTNKFESVVTQIRATNPDTIIFLSTATATEELIRQLGMEQLIGKNILGTSQLTSRSFKLFLKDKGLTCVTSNNVPDPRNSDLEIAQQFRAYACQKNIALDAPTFEAFIATDIFIYLLNQISGDITTEKIINHAEQLSGYNHKGLELSFDRQTRELSTSLWLDTGKDTWTKHTKKIIPNDALTEVTK